MMPANRIRLGHVAESAGPTALVSLYVNGDLSVGVHCGGCSDGVIYPPPLTVELARCYGTGAVGGRVDDQVQLDFPACAQLLGYVSQTLTKPRVMQFGLHYVF
jgi:hypothetical protein